MGQQSKYADNGCIPASEDGRLSHFGLNPSVWKSEYDIQGRPPSSYGMQVA